METRNINRSILKFSRWSNCSGGHTGAGVVWGPHQECRTTGVMRTIILSCAVQTESLRKAIVSEAQGGTGIGKDGCRWSGRVQISWTPDPSIDPHSDLSVSKLSASAMWVIPQQTMHTAQGWGSWGRTWLMLEQLQTWPHPTPPYPGSHTSIRWALPPFPSNLPYLCASLPVSKQCDPH